MSKGDEKIIIPRVAVDNLIEAARAIYKSDLEIAESSDGYISQETKALGQALAAISDHEESRLRDRANIALEQVGQTAGRSLRPIYDYIEFLEKKHG